VCLMLFCFSFLMRKEINPLSLSILGTLKVLESIRNTFKMQISY